jgi:hypothetical protein
MVELNASELVKVIPAVSKVIPAGTDTGGFIETIKAADRILTNINELLKTLNSMRGESEQRLDNPVINTVIPQITAPQAQVKPNPIITILLPQAIKYVEGKVNENPKITVGEIITQIPVSGKDFLDVVRAFIPKG